MGFLGVCLYGEFIGENIFVQVTLLCGCFEVGDPKWGMYVFFVFCLGVLKVVVICLCD